MKILTFNYHEPYICMMAKTGLEIDVIEHFDNIHKPWRNQLRDLPSNCTLVSQEEALSKIDSSQYRCIVCHHLREDIPLVWDFPVPKILVIHSLLRYLIENGRSGIDYHDTMEKFKDFFSQVPGLTLVFISNKKRDEWNIGGEVIYHGIDTDDFLEYRGNWPKVLRVGNYIVENVHSGYPIQESLLEGVACSTFGDNPGLGNGSSGMKHLDEMKRHYQRHRLYLTTSLSEYEDGFNLCLLEAMASGMPVVSYVNDTSPIIDGINGHISSDIDYLRDKVQHLLEDHESAQRLGNRAKESVQELFPFETFKNRWLSLIKNV